MKTNALGVPRPTSPLLDKFDVDAAKAAYEPGIIAEDELVAPDDSWTIRFSLSGSAEYPAIGALGGGEADDDTLFWTGVWWCHAVGVHPDTSYRCTMNRNQFDTFRLGGLYRYADLPYHPEELLDP